MSRALHEYTSTFQLISNLSAWHRRYYDYYEKDSNYLYDRANKAYAILFATFETLSEYKQLRVKRFAGYTGLGYERSWYHEIQILNQNQEVVETLLTTLEGDGTDSTATANNTLIKSSMNLIAYLDNGELRIDESVVQINILIPVQLPNYPEFRDHSGNVLKCYHGTYNKNYYPLSIMIDKECITDMFHTSEVREERVRNHTIAQCKKIKEELMINRWSPARVEKLLLAGYDIEDI